MTVNNSTPHRKNKTRGCSFRINEEWLNVLTEEADKQAISVNSLMNKILRQYSFQYRHMKRFGSVVLSRTLLTKIIDCCTESEIKEIAQFTGSIETKDALRTLGIHSTYDKVLEHLKSVGIFGGWFDFTQHTKDAGEYLHLRHEFGKKWSKFLAETISTVFKSILNTEIKIEVFDNYVTIQLPT
ncbi:MAG: hypothetical protein NWF06_02040 [Candidatus Bathyarchaeota archaeon]|nr:hypothetical protein [Candidatus Bathyarchaeum sp.]